MKNIKNSQKTLTNILLLTISMLIIICTLQASFAANATINDTSTGGILQGIADTESQGTLTLQPGTYNKANQDRNININKSITIQGNGPTDTVKIDGQNLSRIFLISDNINVTFINLTFLNGNVTGDGGAINNPNTNSTLTFINCIFIDNTASNRGGAINNNGPNLHVTNSNFINNYASVYGGAIRNNAINMTVIGSNFNNNSANRSGGAIFSSEDYLTVINSSFTNNYANRNGGAIRNRGNNDLVLNSSFTNNTANERGGAIYNYRGDNMTIKDSTFTNNNALNGGAIFNTGLSPNFKVEGSTFINNNATNGGAIRNSGVNLTINKSNFIANTAISGGAIFNTGTGQNMTVTGSNFINNIAVNGSAIDNRGSDSTIQCNRFLNNTGFTILNTGSRTNADFNWWGNNSNPNPLVSGITINNYYTMIFNSTDTVGKVVGNNLTVNYALVLNGTNNNAGANLLPYFTTTIYYNGKAVSTIDARKTQNLTIPLTTAGPTNITAITDNQAASILLDVGKGNTNSTINLPSDITVGQKINISGLVKDQSGNPIANTNITVTVNGIPYTVKTNSNGNWVLPYKVINAGNLNVTVNWQGNNNYYGFTNTTSNNVAKGNVTVKLKYTKNPDGSVTITATATDTSGEPVSNLPVQFSLNGKVVGNNVTNVNGIATYTIAAKQLVNGTNNVTVNVDGGNNFNNATANIAFNYTPKKNETNKTNDTDSNLYGYWYYVTSDDTSSKAVTMKKTAVPIIAILLLFLCILGISANRKVQK